MRSNHRAQNRSQQGIALLIAIFALLLISGAAIGMIVMSGTESAINANYRRSTITFYHGSAGLEEARERMVPCSPNSFWPVTACANPPVSNDPLFNDNPANPAYNPVVVGTFNVNTTGNGVLRVVVNLSSAEEAADMTDVPIRVIIRQQLPYIPAQINTNFPAAITTNGQGQGNATLKVELPDFSAFDPGPTEIQVMVFVNPGGSPNLFEGAANLTVPLK